MISKNHEIDYGKQNIGKVFEEWYTIPSYQRNYVWESDNIYDFLKDIEENYEEHANDEYFLGSYIKQNRENTNDLLDGQQRITTLFLFFAFMRDYERTPDELRDGLQELIFQKGSIVKKIEPKVRLTYQIRGTVKDFIRYKIIPEGSILKNWEEIVQKAGDPKANISESHICNTLVCFKKYFDEQPEIDITKYIQFITLNVVMIYVSANTLEDAFRLFSVMNDRGLKLSNADILKSSNLEKLADKNDVNDYAKKWEDMQADLGNDIDRFLLYVRNIILKSRVRTNLLDEYENNIFKAGKLKRGDAFFELVFKIYEIFDKVINLTDNDDVAFGNLIRILLSSMQNTEWIPSILLYYMKFQNKGLLSFTKRVVCKNIADSICGESPSSRIDALNKIMVEVETASSPEDLLNASCFKFDSVKFLTSIQMDVYGHFYTKPLLMLLEYEEQDNSLVNSFNQISIEHILPQNPSTTSKWVQDFTEEQRTDMTHKVGNLCLIGRRKNTSLGNLDYLDKRKRYFEKNINSFARTLQIYNTYPSQWTPAELSENQAITIQKIKKIFGV